MIFAINRVSAILYPPRIPVAFHIVSLREIKYSKLWFDKIIIISQHDLHFLVLASFIFEIADTILTVSIQFVS